MPNEQKRLRSGYGSPSRLASGEGMRATQRWRLASSASSSGLRTRLSRESSARIRSSSSGVFPEAKSSTRQAHAERQEAWGAPTPWQLSTQLAWNCSRSVLPPPKTEPVVMRRVARPTSARARSPPRIEVDARVKEESGTKSADASRKRRERFAFVPSCASRAHPAAPPRTTPYGFTTPAETSFRRSVSTRPRFTPKSE